MTAGPLVGEVDVFCGQIDAVARGETSQETFHIMAGERRQVPGLMGKQFSELAAVFAGPQRGQRPYGRGHKDEPVAKAILLGPQVEEHASVDLLERFVELVEQQDQLVLAVLQGGGQAITETEGHLKDVGGRHQALVGALQFGVSGQNRAAFL